MSAPHLAAPFFAPRSARRGSPHTSVSMMCWGARQMIPKTARGMRLQFLEKPAPEMSLNVPRNRPNFQDETLSAD